MSRAQRDRIDARYRAGKQEAQEAARQTAAAKAAARPGADERPAAAHCWVRGPEEDPGPFAGVMTAWRRHPWGGWMARVTYAVPRAGGDTLLVQQWLEDGQVEQVHGLRQPSR